MDPPKGMALGWLTPAPLEDDGVVQQSQQLALLHFGGDHQWAADTQWPHSKYLHGVGTAQAQKYKMQIFTAAGLILCLMCQVIWVVGILLDPRGQL